MEEKLTENAARKWIWARKDIVDDMTSSESFKGLPPEEQDAIVISLQLDIPQESVKRCLANEGTEEEMATLRSRIAETFKYGKRSAIRPLKMALAAHAHLNPRRESGD